MAPFSHLLLTRFNCRFAATWSSRSRDAQWLEHRFRLFETVCYPSVKAQDTQRFAWIVFFAKETPASFKSRVLRYAEWPVFRPVFVRHLDDAEVSAAVVDNLDPRAEFLITSRLDNDDALARDYIQRVQGSFEARREYVNFTNGCVLHDGKLYFVKDRNNAFVSLIENRRGFRTVWAQRHTEIASDGPVRQLGGEPGWLQVIHSNNVTNRVRGSRYPARRLHEYFEIKLPELSKDEAALSYWTDRLLLTPPRFGREMLFSLARRARRLCGITR